MLEMTGGQAASLYLALHLILLIALAYGVVKKRQTGISLGDGGDIEMQRRIRIHGNFTEYAPLFLIGLFALAGLGAPVIIIHGLGIVFTLARCGHAFNFHNEGGSVPRGRFFGTLFTWICIVALALCLLYFVFAG